LTDNFSVRRPRTIDERISESMTKREIDFIQKLKPEFLSGRFFNGNIGSSKTDGTPNGGGSSSNPPLTGSGGSDGGVCGTRTAGVVSCMKLNFQQGLVTGGIIISVGIRACGAGGNARLKVLDDGVNCAFVPFSFPRNVIAETDSFPLLDGFNDVPLSVTIPHDTYYSGSPGCGANHPDFGAVWIGVEVQTDKDLGFYGVTPFFGYTYSRVHTYGPGAPGFNYPSDIATFAYNIRISWVQTV